MPELRIEGRNAAETMNWLRSIARLVIKEHIGPRGNASDLPASAAPTDAPGRLRARWKAVEPCVERLPESQRQVVELRFREGMRYADIADCLGIPIGTVRSRLARARPVIDGRARDRENGVDASEGSPADAGPAELAGMGSAAPGDA